MRVIKITGTCLLAVLALSVMAVASAQAKDVESGPVGLTDAGEGAAELGTSVINIKCTKHSAVGEITTEKGGTATSKYEGCEIAGKGVACENVAAKEIETKALVDELGYINKAKDEVGSDFKPASGESGTLAEFTCSGTTKVRVYGSVIGKITSHINEMAETTKLSFVGEGFKNNPAEFEGGKEDVLLTEFPELTGTTKTNSEQKQSDTVTTKPGDCTVSKGKEKCKEKDPAEISTLEVTCTGETCTTAKRAEPLYGRCEKKKEGAYKDKNCSEAGEIKKGKKKGKYEFVPV